LPVCALLLVANLFDCRALDCRGQLEKYAALDERAQACGWALFHGMTFSTVSDLSYS
jgi:hypothetical protein